MSAASRVGALGAAALSIGHQRKAMRSRYPLLAASIESGLVVSVGVPDSETNGTPVTDAAPMIADGIAALVDEQP